MVQYNEEKALKTKKAKIMINDFLKISLVATSLTPVLAGSLHASSVDAIFADVYNDLGISNQLEPSSGNKSFQMAAVEDDAYADYYNQLGNQISNYGSADAFPLMDAPATTVAQPVMQQAAPQIIVPASSPLAMPSQYDSMSDAELIKALNQQYAAPASAPIISQNIAAAPILAAAQPVKAPSRSNRKMSDAEMANMLGSQVLGNDIPVAAPAVQASNAISYNVQPVVQEVPIVLPNGEFIRNNNQRILSSANPEDLVAGNALSPASDFKGERVVGDVNIKGGTYVDGTLDSPMVREGAVSGSIIREVSVTEQVAPTIEAPDSAYLRPTGPIRSLPKKLPPFRISIDGKALDGDRRNYGRACCDDRSVDVALANTDIQVKFDGLELTPVLSVTASPNIASAAQGAVEFKPYWNYGGWITSAEIRIFKAGDSTQGEPLAVVPYQPATDSSIWQIPAGFGTEYGDAVQYLLRVYSKDNRFDETHAKELVIRANATNDRSATQAEKLLAGYGKNELRKQNISLSGGTTTVFGKKVPSGHTVYVMGKKIPVDPSGSFVAQEMLPVGQNKVTIAIVDESNNNKGIEFQREVEIKDSEYFYVGLGDFTYGQNDFSGPANIENSNPGEYESEYFHGRAAFYLKGKVKGKYLITAMADTGESDIDEMFKGFDKKQHKELFRRLDPDRYYPIYGDDSTITQDAPTQGKFYVRVERDSSHAMWGNYYTNIVDTDFAHIDRALYGGKIAIETNRATSYGEPTTKLVGFAAEPETIYNREDFRGTGGSVYFMEYQDITPGSERLRVEIRDAISGIVLTTRTLIYGEDYDVDWIKGRVLLNKPLSSTADNSSIIQAPAAQFGNPVYLVSQYEVTPINQDVDGHVAGGTLQQWVGDHLKVGGTILDEDTGNASADRKLYGGNITLRYKPGTYIKGEYVQTEGAHQRSATSDNGGFLTANNSSTITAPIADDEKSTGYRIEASVALDEVSNMEAGRINAYYIDKEAGFAAPGEETSSDEIRYGARAHLPFNSGRTEITAAYDASEIANSDSSRASLEVRQKFGENFSVGVGASLDDTDTAGERIDVAGELRYESGDDWQVYAFAQDTVEEDNTELRNARYGIGGDIAVTDKLKLGGEVEIDDDSEIGARVSADYAYSDRSNFYMAYELVDRTNTGTGAGSSPLSTLSNRGALTIGARSRYTDSLSVYGEEQLWHEGSGIDGITHNYGVDYTPNERWTLGASFETGTIDDLERTAIAANVGFDNNDGFTIGLAGEARFEDDKAVGGTNEFDTYLARLTTDYNINDELNAYAKLNASFSESNSDVNEGEFIEGSVALAYRPIDNDKFNALAKYTFLYDISTKPQQLNNAPDYEQRSHVASIDVSYDLNRYLTLGGKYGLKMGEVKLPNTSDWIESTLHLGILRGDVHIVHNWDALFEGRILHEEESDTTRTGALVAIYRHIGKNIKLGVGYNFSDFSDDLTNVSFDNHGWFINLVTKF